MSLLTLMLVKAWVIPLICLDYQVRKDYIAKTFCINKNRPKLNCNGKCYLAKKLAEAEKQQQRQAEQDYLASLIYQVMDAGNRFTFSSPALSFEGRKILPYQYVSPFLGRLVSGSVFHPPIA